LNGTIEFNSEINVGTKVIVKFSKWGDLIENFVSWWWRITIGKTRKCL
jgi:hypothetical protein